MGTGLHTDHRNPTFPGRDGSSRPLAKALVTSASLHTRWPQPAALLNGRSGWIVERLCKCRDVLSCCAALSLDTPQLWLGAR